MASKRSIKKDIRYICGDIAGECLFSETVFDGIDKNQMAQVIIDLATLQDDSIKKVSVSFDRSARDFETMKEYKKARRDYFKKCYTVLMSQFSDGINDIVKEMNAMMPSSIKEANKKVAE